MGKKEVLDRIKGLNEYMLSDSNKQLVLLRQSSDYTYNKALSIQDKNELNNNWYAVDDKYSVKTWDELEAYLDGICTGKNTKFYEEDER